MNCGASFAVGQSVLIAAAGDAERGYHTSMCVQAPVSYEDGAAAVLAAAARYRDKLRRLDEAVERDPTDTAALLAKAQFLGATSSVLEALATVETLLKIEPLHREGIFLKHDLLASRGQDTEALAVLEPYLAAHPDDADAGRRLAVTLARLKRIDDVAAGWRDFTGLIAEGIDFSGRALDNASFRNAKLKSVSFAGADLRKADLSGAWIQEGDFSRAQLAGANLKKIHITGSMKGADLRGADLTDSDILADLSGADLSEAQASDSEFYGKIGLTGARAVGLHAAHSIFSAIDLSGANLEGADLTGAKFVGTQLIGANLRDADLSGATFVYFSADRPGNLSGADLTGARLENVNFVSVLYDCATRWPDGFDPVAQKMVPARGSEACSRKPDFAWLKEPVEHKPYRISGDGNFSGMDLAGVSFRGAWMPGEIFSDADLRGADFCRAKGEAQFRGTDEGAKFRGAILYLRSFFPKGNGVTSADLSRADLSGAIIADDPAEWPSHIDPVQAGVIFRDSAAAAILFPGYSLRNADVRGFDLSGFNLTGLDLSGADLRGAALYGADLKSTRLDGANLKGACVQDRIAWPAGFDIFKAGAIYCPVYHLVYNGQDAGLSSPWAHSRGGLSQVLGLQMLTLPIPNLAGENWDEAMFAAAWLQGADMAGGSFIHTTFQAANLTAASLRQANLSGADLRDALLDQADLTSASLRDADLRSTSLKETILTGADLTGALYDEATAWPVGFDPAAAGAQKQR